VARLRRKALETDAQGWPRCIHLAGVDGTGKSTQARALMAKLEAEGTPARQVWLRFPRLLSIPFLVYARLRGYSRREVVNGYEHGYWHFEPSWLMSRVFPWVLLLDTAVLALIKVYLPLNLGSVVVCDRFVVDILADLMAGLGDERFDERLPGHLFLALLPRNSRVVILDLDTETARQRSPELEGDRSHAERRKVYLEIARRRHFPVVSAASPVEEVTSQVIDRINTSAPAAPSGGKLLPGGPVIGGNRGYQR
jgi:thymidylate kinase